MKIKNIERIIRIYLLIGTLYFFGEALIHIFSLRLVDIQTAWPREAVVYSRWMTGFYGGLALFIASLLFVIRQNIQQYKHILYCIAVYAALHASFLLYAAATVDFDTIYSNFPSLSFWIPLYNSFLIIEAVLLYAYTIIIICWYTKTKKSSQ